VSVLAAALASTACSESALVGENAPRVQRPAASAPGEAGAPAVQLARSEARLSASAAGACAIGVAGTAHCWGDNLSGTLGSGEEERESASSPVRVRALTSVQAIFGGPVSQCALRTDGRVVCWGDCIFGDINDMKGVHAITFSPMAVDGLGDDVAHLALGTYFHCALTTGGAVKCWGLNGSGQLGNPTRTDAYVPAQVEGLDGPATFVAAGMPGAFACAVTRGGGVQCWGGNDSGQLGDGTHSDARSPVRVAGLADVSALALGGSHACALGADGRVRCWGRGDRGQLGDGARASRDAPVDVAGIAGAIAIGAGVRHTCALQADGAVACWGDNDAGQVGAGAREVARPVVALGKDWGARQIAVGVAHTCAINAANVVRCWGDGSRGQVGTGGDIRL
jgi:alpha-tubulin suppressor-like RCC1 family protein